MSSSSFVSRWGRTTDEIISQIKTKLVTPRSGVPAAGGGSTEPSNNNNKLILLPPPPLLTPPIPIHCVEELIAELCATDQQKQVDTLREISTNATDRHHPLVAIIQRLLSSSPPQDDDVTVVADLTQPPPSTSSGTADILTIFELPTTMINTISAIPPHEFAAATIPKKKKRAHFQLPSEHRIESPICPQSGSRGQSPRDPCNGSRTESPICPIFGASTTTTTATVSSSSSSSKTNPEKKQNKILHVINPTYSKTNDTNTFFDLYDALEYISKQQCTAVYDVRVAPGVYSLAPRSKHQNSVLHFHNAPKILIRSFDPPPHTGSTNNSGSCSRILRRHARFWSSSSSPSQKKSNDDDRLTDILAQSANQAVFYNYNLRCRGVYHASFFDCVFINSSTTTAPQAVLLFYLSAGSLTFRGCSFFSTLLSDSNNTTNATELEGTSSSCGWTPAWGLCIHASRSLTSTSHKIDIEDCSFESFDDSKVIERNHSHAVIIYGTTTLLSELKQKKQKKGEHKSFQTSGFECAVVFRRCRMINKRATILINNANSCILDQCLFVQQQHHHQQEATESSGLLHLQFIREFVEIRNTFFVNFHQAALVLNFNPVVLPSIILSHNTFQGVWFKSVAIKLDPLHGSRGQSPLEAHGHMTLAEGLDAQNMGQIGLSVLDPLQSSPLDRSKVLKNPLRSILETNKPTKTMPFEISDNQFVSCRRIIASPAWASAGLALYKNTVQDCICFFCCGGCGDNGEEKKDTQQQQHYLLVHRDTIIINHPERWSSNDEKLTMVLSSSSCAGNDDDKIGQWQKTFFVIQTLEIGVLYLLDAKTISWTLELIKMDDRQQRQIVSDSVSRGQSPRDPCNGSRPSARVMWPWASRTESPICSTFGAYTVFPYCICFDSTDMDEQQTPFRFKIYLPYELLGADIDKQWKLMNEYGTFLTDGCEIQCKSNKWLRLDVDVRQLLPEKNVHYLFLCL